MTGVFLKYRSRIKKSLLTSDNDSLVPQLISLLSDFHCIHEFCLFYTMFFVALLAIAAAAVSASPVERRAQTAVLPLKHVSNVTSIKNIVGRGQARINAINGVQAASAASEVSSGSVTNEDVTYVASVSIGGNTWQLIVDTGCTCLLQDAQGALETLY
jgi:hypothetical protein